MASHLELVRVASPPSIPLEMTADMRKFVMDTVGGVMYVEYKNGEVRECQK